MEATGNKFYDPKGSWTKAQWNDLYKKADPFTYLNDYNEKIRERVILDFVKWSKMENILDVGCGEGVLTESVSKYAKHVDAFDISQNAINYAKANHDNSNINYFDLDASEYEAKDAHYDLVLCSEMIYYLSSSQITKLLQEISKSLKGNGYLLLSSRCTDYFSVDGLVALLSNNFKVINVFPCWRPDRFWAKIIKRIFGYLSPHFDDTYIMWLKSRSPYTAYMSCFVCLTR